MELLFIMSKTESRKYWLVLFVDFGNQTFSRQDAFAFESDSDTVSAEPRDIPELDDTSNDGPWTGLVVCVNKTIVTIWSQVHGYVRADMELKESGQVLKFLDFNANLTLIRLEITITI